VYTLGNKLPNGYFDSFETLTDEQARQALHDSWTTMEQRIYNAMIETCPECKGQGYLKHRTKSGQVVRENCGCPQCKGTGAILK
jgi:DnaJ-class molecular chaperone